LKICIYSDPHWSTYSSILRQRDIRYSKRLKTLIKSINWVEELAILNNCSSIFCLGDFFDRNNLNAEEITALNEIKWSKVQHTFIVGNHEITKDDLSMNSMNVLAKIGQVVKTPLYIEFNDFNIVIIPYVDEDNREPLDKIMNNLSVNRNKKTIIMSHNDIAGIRYGAYVSESGFSIEEIERNCDLYLNGHLHNGEWVTNKILNVGNLSGQNFTEDGFRYRHCAFILNTDTLELTAYENPYAINFYKVEINNINDLFILDELKNACVSLTVKESLIDSVREKIKILDNIVAHRLIVVPNEELTNEIDSGELIGKVNHLDKFNEFILNEIGNFDIVKYELDKICTWTSKE